MLSCVVRGAVTTAKRWPTTYSLASFAKPLSTMERETALVHHPFPINGMPINTDGVDMKKDLFAVVELSGTQYKVTQDDLIVIDKMDGVDIGQKIQLDKVLLLGNRSNTLIGKPLIAGATVVASVEEVAKDKKVITLKFRRRKNSRNIRGFRRQLTILRIDDFELDADVTKDLTSSS